MRPLWVIITFIVIFCICNARAAKKTCCHCGDGNSQALEGSQERTTHISTSSKPRRPSVTMQIPSDDGRVKDTAFLGCVKELFSKVLFGIIEVILLLMAIPLVYFLGTVIGLIFNSFPRFPEHFPNIEPLIYVFCAILGFKIILSLLG